VAADIDVLVPTCGRPDGLAVTLAGLSSQTCRRFRVLLSDQSLGPVSGAPLVAATTRILSYRDDHRPAELEPFEEWHDAVLPERVRRGGAQWRRHLLHNAANPTHLADRLNLGQGEWRAYKIAWIGGCVLYRREALVETGGFSFWPALPPEHAGEDVVAQLRVMERYGGAGLLPSGAVHLELPTMVARRDVEAYDAVDL
jgi:hypothetical protein